MKLVSIIRHAKAEPLAAYGSDFDRCLTNRGQKDAIQIAKRLTKLEPPVDWWLSSPALRASQTTILMTEEIGYSNPIYWNELIYMTNAQTLLDLLNEVPDEVEHVALVGHNPTMEMLVSGLCTGLPLNFNLSMSTGTWPMSSLISIAGSKFAGTVDCYICYYDPKFYGNSGNRC